MDLSSVSKSLCIWMISTSRQTTSTTSWYEGSTYSINHGEGSRNFATYITKLPSYSSKIKGVKSQETIEVQNCNESIICSFCIWMISEYKISHTIAMLRHLYYATYFALQFRISCLFPQKEHFDSPIYVIWHPTFQRQQIYPSLQMNSTDYFGSALHLLPLASPSNAQYLGLSRYGLQRSFID